MLKLFTVITLLSFVLQVSAADLDRLAKDNWVKITSSNFEIITDLEAEEAQYLIKDLEAFRYFVVELMGLQMLEGLPPLKILAINSHLNFNRLDLPSNWGGLFSLSLAGYAAIASVSHYKDMNKPSIGRHILLHEYVHHLMRFRKLTRTYPKWYDEGNADYLGTFRFDGTYVYLGEIGALKDRIWGVNNTAGRLVFNSEKLMNTETLDMTSEKRSAQEAVSVFYGQAFFLVQYINTDPVLKAALQNYLYDIYLGYPQNLAFTRSFKMTYKELDQRVIKYMKKDLKAAVYGGKSKDKPLRFPEVEFKIIPVSRAEFFAELTDILPKFTLVPKEMRELLLQKAIKSNPQNYELQTKALIYGAAKSPTDLITTLEQNAPNNSILLTYKANQKAHQATLLRQTGSESWIAVMKEARSLYRNAIKADPINAMAYKGLGDVYLYLPDSEPLREGVLGFNQASLFMPNDKGFIGIADIALRMKDNSEVRMALRNAIAIGDKKTAANYGYILDNLELLLDLASTNPIKKEGGLVYEEGSYYQGPLKNSKPHGIGKITRVNGSFYEGEFVNGIMQGKGRLWSTHGVDYKGDFSEGIMRGKAVVTFPETLPYTHYEGEVEYGQPHGEGTYTSEKGKYTGEFWWSLANGKGEFTTAGNNKHLTGRWIYSRYEWPAQDGEVFVGYINHEGWRTGHGFCRPADSYDAITPCEYQRGAKVVSAE